MAKKIVKWFTYAMLGVLAFCLIFSLSACGLMPSTSDDTADADGDEEKREANIYDSYDDSRPNYDEEFDFESGYTPAYTPEGVPVAVTIVLPNEISLSSTYDNSIWETGMTMTMDTLPQEEDLVGYEAYSTAHDKHLIGWYVYDEEGNYTRLTSDGMYGISDTTPLTVYPLFQDNFYDLDVNSGRANSGNDQTTINDMGVGSGVKYPTSTSQSNTAAYFETAFNTNDFIEEQTLEYTDGLYVGNWFRINTNYLVDGTVTAFEEGKTYTASYALTNYCDEPIIITLYHASNGWPYNPANNKYTAYDFDKDILVMDPGETAYSTLTVTYSAEGATDPDNKGLRINFLTSVIYGAWYNTTSFADADCESKKTGISNDGLETITDFRMGIRCHVEETDYVNVRYSLPEGVTFAQDSGYTVDAFETPVNSNLELPSGDDLVYTGAYANQYLLEWHLADESGKDTGTVITDSYRITSDCVLVPVFADKCTITIEPLDGVTFSYTTAYAAKGGTLKLPSVTLSSDADVYGYYISGDSGQTVIGQPRDTITVTGDMTLCLKIENISTRVTVTLANGYDDVVKINSLAVEHIHNGEAGALYEALYGDGVDISYSEYKDFGETPTWEVSCDNGSTWVIVTESYAIPSTVSSVIIRPVCSDMYITVTVDSSVEHFTLTSDSSFKVVYGDTWGQYLSDEEIGNNIEYELSDGYLFAYWTVDGTAINLDDKIPYHGGAITLVPVVNTAAKISLELPDGVTISSDYKLPAIAAGGTISESDLPTTEDFTGIENGREVIGWYAIDVSSSGKTTNVIIGDGYRISDTVTLAPYWSRVEESYVAVFDDGSTGDLVFLNEQYNENWSSYGRPGTISNGLSHSNFTAIPSIHENVYPVSAGGGYAELGTYFSYNGTMSVGEYFRCATEVDESKKVVTTNQNHAFIYTFENIGTTDIYLSMQLVNSGTDAEGDVYYVYLKPGESIQFTIVMSFSNGSANNNIMALFTVDKEMSGMSMAASVSIVLNNTTGLAEGYVTNATDPVYAKESYTLTYVLPTGATLAESFNDGSYSLVQIREKGIVLPTADDIILEEGEAKYKKLTWYVEKNGQYTEVKEGDDFEADTTIYLKIEDIKITVTVNISGLDGISFSSGGTTATFEAVYGELWSKYLSDETSEEIVGYTLSEGYSVTGWRTESWDTINLGDIVPAEGIAIFPVLAYVGEVEVKLSNAYSENIVTIISLDGHVLASVEGALYGALHGQGAVIEYNQYKDFGEYVWYVTADGSQWEEVTEDYAVPDGVTSVTVYLKYKDIKITITVDGSVENFTLTSEHTFEVTYGDTWGQYLSSGEIGNNVEYEIGEGYVFGHWTVDGVEVDFSAIVPNEQGITLVPVLNKLVAIELELPNDVTLSEDVKMPELIDGDTLYEKDLPTTEDFTGVENKRTVAGWYVIQKDVETGQTTNTIIGSGGYPIESETITIAPYWTRVDGSYTAVFDNGTTGDPVFLNEQKNGTDKGKPGTTSSGLNHGNFTAIPSNYENVYPVSAGGGYAELGTYFSYTGTMAVGEYFRCATEINEQTAVVTVGEEHAFVYTFENIGTTDIYLTMQLVNQQTNAEGDIYYVYLKPGESIQFTIVMAFSNGGDNNNIMALFTVDKEMNGMKMAASVSFVLNNSTKLSEGYVTNSDEYVEVRYVLSDGATLVSSFNGGRYTLVSVKGKGVSLPTAEDIVLSDGNDARYKKLTWYVYENGEYKIVADNYALTSDTTIHLKIEDISITVTVDISGLEGISFGSGYTATFEAIYGQNWSEYLGEGIQEKIGYTLETDYTVTGWQTADGEKIDLATGIVPGEDITIVPVIAYEGAVDVVLADGYSNIVTINSLDGFVHAGAEGSLYNALLGENADIKYSEYKNFGETPTWEVSTDGGSTWATVTEDYVVSGTLSVIVRPKYDDIKITITIDDSDENFSFTADSIEVVYGDTWSDYISSSELTNYEFELADRYVITGWTKDGVSIDLDKIIPNDVGITIAPILTKMADIFLVLPDGVTMKTTYNMPELINGDILYVSDLPANDAFENIEYGREIIGWYVIEKDAETGQTTNVLIGSSGYTIESETVTVAPYWSRVDGSYTGSFKDGKSGDLVFLNEQYDTSYGSSYKKPGTISSGLSHDNFEGIPSVYENVYPVSAGGGYAEFGTYFSYTGTMAVGEYFRCATEVDESAKVVTINEDHAFIYTFENIGTTDIWLSMRLVNSGTDAEGDIYYVYLKPGESIQFTIVMAFSNGGDNNNIMALFTVDKEMNGMKMAASVSFILNNSMNMSTGYVTNATNDIYKEKHTLTYVLPEGAHLASSFNEGSETLVQFRENGIVLPTAEDIILSDGNDARYKKLTWYVYEDGEYKIVSSGDDFASDMTICLYVEDITVSITVDFSNISGISYADGSSTTFNAVYGNLWSEYLNESSLGYTLETGYFVAGWQTSSGEDIDLSDIVPNEDVSVKPVVEYANVTVTIGSVSGVTVSASTIDAYVGANLLSLIETDMASGTLIVTTDSDITELKGWSLADGGEMIGSDYTVSGNVTIYPVIGYKAATVTIKIETEGVDVEFTYNGQKYTNGDTIVLETTCMDNLYELLNDLNISGNVLNEGYEFSGLWSFENGTVITEESQIEAISIAVVPVISRKSYSVSVRTIEGDDGSVIFEASGYSTTYVVYGDTFALPSAEQVTNSTGKELIGWVIKYADGSYSVSYTYVKGTSNVTVTRTGDYSLGAEIEMPAGNIEILPLLYESDEYIPWELDYYRDVNGKDNNTRKNVFTTGAYYSEATYETDYFIKDTEDGVMSAGDYIRYKNAYDVVNATGYDFHYTITNLGSTTITIKIYQMSGGADLSEKVSAQSEELTITPGETVTVSFYDIEDLGNNSNTLTIIQAVGEITGLYLGINERIDVHENVSPASASSTYSGEASLEEKRRGC